MLAEFVDLLTHATSNNDVVRGEDALDVFEEEVEPLTTSSLAVVNPLPIHNLRIPFAT